MTGDRIETIGDSWDAAMRLAFGGRRPENEAPAAPEGPTARLPGDLLAPGLPRRHGRYLVEREIARGGMGRVFMAHDEDLRRPVAIKVLPDGDDPERMARFLCEARIVARLEHPSIVSIHEFGLDEASHPYFSMRLIEGRTLANELSRDDAGDTRRARRLEILEKVAEAVASAHANGVVHRDLKPDNVMIGEYGEVLVVDWGLAVHRNGVHPTDGIIAGTPNYMAPEQARGECPPHDPRTDVFSLGAMLFEVLSGRMLHGASARLDDVAVGVPRHARSWLQELAAENDLALLALRCLDEQPDGRPSDATGVAEAMKSSRRAAEELVTAARVAEAAASSRARAERKLRRLTMLAALLTIALTMSISEHSRRAERREREHVERTEARILEILDDAALRAGEQDWQGAVDLCSHAERLAREERTGSGIHDRVAEYRSRFEAARAAAEAQRARQESAARLLARIDAALTLPADTMASGHAELDSAFADHGIDILNAPPETTAALLAADEANRPSLLRALDHWASRLRPGVAARRRILDVALRVDLRPWPTRLRRAILDEDHETLRQIAADLDPYRRQAPELELLALSLLDAGDRDGALEVIRASLGAHPGDFWLHLRLSATLAGMDRVRGSPRVQIANEDVAESLAHAGIALALRPESTVVPRLTARIHASRGQNEKAARELDAAERRRPDDVGLLVERGRLLRLEGRFRAMFDIALEAVRREPASEWARLLLRRARELWFTGEGSLDAWREEVSSWSDRASPRARHAELAAIANWTGNAAAVVENVESVLNDGGRLTGDLAAAYVDALLATGRFDDAARFAADGGRGIGRGRLERRISAVIDDDTPLGRARRSYLRGDVERSGALYDEYFADIRLPMEGRMMGGRRPDELRRAARDALRALVTASVLAEQDGDAPRARRLRDRARALLLRELEASRAGHARLPRQFAESARTNLVLRLYDDRLAPVRVDLERFDDAVEVEAWRRLWLDFQGYLTSR